MFRQRKYISARGLVKVFPEEIKECAPLETVPQPSLSSSWQTLEGGKRRWKIWPRQHDRAFSLSLSRNGVSKLEFPYFHRGSRFELASFADHVDVHDRASSTLVVSRSRSRPRGLDSTRRRLEWADEEEGGGKAKEHRERRDGEERNRGRARDRMDRKRGERERERGGRGWLVGAARKEGGTLGNSWGKEARVSGATGGALSHTRKNSPLQLQQRPSASTDQFPHHRYRTQRERQVRLGLQKLLEDTGSNPPPHPVLSRKPPFPSTAAASIPASGSSFTRVICASLGGPWYSPLTPRTPYPTLPPTRFTVYP